MQANTELQQPHLRTETEGLISPVAAKVRAYCDAIRVGGENFQTLHENIVGLEQFIFAEDGTSAASALEEVSAQERAYLNDAYCRWETEIEYQFAEGIISGQHSDMAEYHLGERFSRLIRHELDLLDSPPNRVLFIGSGPLPVSAYYVQAFTGRPVDCLDRDADAVAASRRVIERLGLGDSLRVINGVGESYNVADYDVIIIALLAKPKRRILRNVLKKAAPGCRVLCRTSYGLRTLVYEPAPEDVLLGFEVKGRQVAGDGQTISTLLLEGTAHNAAEVRLRWLDGIDEELSGGLLNLMNRVLRRETTIGFPGPLDPHTGRALFAGLDEDIRAGRRHVLVAEKGGCVLGQVILTPHHLPNCRHLVELSRGIIDPSFRGVGLSLAAFGEIARKCEEVGGETIYLDVRAGTVAAEMWKSFGFVPFGCLEDYARVGGHSYRGLYMSQTVGSLKRQVERLKQRAKASAPPAGSNGAATAAAVAAPAAQSFNDYRKRRVRTLAPFEFDDWRLKVHGVSAGDDELSHTFVNAAREAARAILPRPGVRPPDRYGLGFLVVHAGFDADFVVVCWWGAQNELFLRVLTSPPGRPQLLRERTNREGSVACVWDLAVIWHEREAWARHVMRSGGADVDAYLAATLDAEV